MNVLNMFQEEEPKIKPLIKPEPLEIPPTFTPYIPTNQEQAQQAIIGDQQYAIQPPVEGIAPEPTREERIAKQMEEDMRMGVNPWMKIVQKGTPVLDEEKQKRLKLAAAANAWGQGMATLFGGYVGSKGGPILEQKNDFTPAALLEYNNNLKADQANKYRNAIMEANAGMSAYGQAKSDINQQDNIEQRLKNALEIQTLRNAAMIEAKKNSARTGRSVEDELAILNTKYDRMAEIEALKEERMKELENLKQTGKLSQAQYVSQKRKELEEYKANKAKVTTETESYDNGQAIKTKTEKTTIPPANPKKEKTEAEILKELGITTKGKLLKR